MTEHHQELAEEFASLDRQFNAGNPTKDEFEFLYLLGQDS
jgi:hypothetical protein